MLGQGGRWLTLVRGLGPRREAAARPSDRARGLWSGELGLLSGLPGQGPWGPVTWASGQGVLPPLPLTPSLRVRTLLSLSSQPDRGPGRRWLLSKCLLNRGGVGSGRGRLWP